MNNLHMDIDSLDILNIEIEKVTRSIKNEYEKIDSSIKELQVSMDSALYDSFLEVYNKSKEHSDAVLLQLDNYNKFLASSIANYERRDNNIYDDIDKNDDKLSINE